MLTRTEIAQGPFAMTIALFALFAFWIELSGGWILPCLAALQAYTLTTTWMPGSSIANGHLSPGSLVLVAVVMAATGWLIKGNLSSTDKTAECPSP